MTNYDRDDFCIRRLRVHQPNDVECPFCGDSFQTSGLDLCGPNNQPVCELCGWENATALADLLALSHAVWQHYTGLQPPDICEAIEKRRSDPKRLKKELEQARDVLGRRNGSILAELVIHEVEAALKRDDVDIKRNALKAFREMDINDLDDEIPF